MSERAIVFPGQGAQSVGMGGELFAAFATARRVAEEADEALGRHLSRLMRDGPAETLTMTENAQPALLCHSIAVLRVLVEEGGFDLSRQAHFVAGHSLGEYSALTASGAFKFANAIRLVEERGRAMQLATPPGTGAMAALLGVEFDQGNEIAAAAAAETKLVCVVANDNGGGQLVISGDTDAVARAVALATERGFKRSIMLNVSAPFHSPLMAPAAAIMAEALARIEIQSPDVPLVANVTADAVSDPESIARLLVEQVTGMVRWRESVLYLKEQEIDEVIELGSGKVLAGLTRRIDREMGVRSIGGPADIDAFLASL